MSDLFYLAIAWANDSRQESLEKWQAMMGVQLGALVAKRMSIRRMLTIGRRPVNLGEVRG